MKDRIYFCHTYYHAYVTFLKELNLPKEERGKATLVLSSLSCNFEKLKERVDASGLFEACIPFEEKRDTFYPELAKYRKPKNNIVLHLLQRIIFTKKFGKITGKTVPVDLREYKDIYVYCDADPIGYYLNYAHIPYHALEDGLNSVKNCDGAHYENRGHFALKAFLSEKLNLIFIQQGYGRYCIDMEVNEIASLKYPHHKYIEQNRQELVDNLSEADKELILNAFIRNRKELDAQLQDKTSIQNMILILTDPLCDLETRERIFRDIIERYEKEGKIFLKPHPRDVLDYATLFREYPQIDATVPMEMLNFYPGLRFQKVVAVLTEISGIHFANEVIRLGNDFMDAYEDPLIHRQNEQI